MNNFYNINNFFRWEIISGFIITIGSKILFGIIIFLLGLQLIKVLVENSKKLLGKVYDDPTLISFISSLLSVTLKLLLAISALSLIGIEMSAFVALFGAAGLAIGLAFQGTLANFAAGVLMLIFRPFNVGDVIKSQDLSGKVREIQILYTIIDTDDNKRIVMPNGGVYSNMIFVNGKK